MFPGPTALVLAVNINTNADPYLKVEGITDEFCSLFKTGDVMAKMEEAVQHGMEEHFHYEDEDVNRSAKTDATATANVATADGATTKNMADLKKRKRPAASTRRRKSKR